jgi:adenosylcobinamide kinase/adenosylcobinamide-phosphate guanylyltransferase
LEADNKDLVFVINDVSSSVVSSNPLVRKFVVANGKVAQFVASECDEVYHVVAGIATRIK